MEEESIPYKRVGVNYYKTVLVPTIAGHTNETLVPWNEHTIKSDFGKDYLAGIPKYDGFTCIPSHIRYSREFSTFYNRYHPLSHKPEKGSINKSIELVKHIFGDQFETGLDYIQLLYTKPIQALPILCLVSTERSTGKSTFLKWLKEIFEHNATFLTNDSFASQFNADWADKLIIGIDEVLFKKEELTERIKYLSTANRYKLESKGKDKREVEFFGKFILCSNNEYNFIKIDSNSTRFWVRKIPIIIRENTEFLNDLISEIPAFLYFLTQRELSTHQQTRMWFSPEQIYTDALRLLMQSNKSSLETEMANILFMVIGSYDWSELSFCTNDILYALKSTGKRSDLTQVRKVIKDNWKLEPQSNSKTYEKFSILSDGSIITSPGKGRYFTITKDFILSNFVDLMPD